MDGGRTGSDMTSRESKSVGRKGDMSDVMWKRKEGDDSDVIWTKES